MSMRTKNLHDNLLIFTFWSISNHFNTCVILSIIMQCVFSFATQSGVATEICNNATFCVKLGNKTTWSKDKIYWLFQRTFFTEIARIQGKKIGEDLLDNFPMRPTKMYSNFHCTRKTTILVIPQYFCSLFWQIREWTIKQENAYITVHMPVLNYCYFLLQLWRFSFHKMDDGLKRARILPGTARHAMQTVHTTQVWHNVSCFWKRLDKLSRLCFQRNVDTGYDGLLLDYYQPLIITLFTRSSHRICCRRIQK